MNFRTARLGQYVRIGYVLAIMVLAIAAAPISAWAAPYADMVIDARTGQVLHETNADTRLHPASLTKMMTLYIAFEAIERGEISLDSKVTISSNAASEPPSKLGLKVGQQIALRYLIRAAAVKSANDAATAIGEAIEGSESAFAKRMNRTAKALGMTRTTFRNANGLTAEGHLSTARDMTTLGRRVFYDYPQYYNLFSRRSADAGVATVNSTNRRFLDSYKGADGIKTGYTTPAGFNLVASAERGDKRIIATVFGGKSTATRNARVVELLDIGFGKAPRKAVVQKPALPQYVAEADPENFDSVAVSGIGTTAAGKTLRLSRAVTKSPRPLPRPKAGGPGTTIPDDLLMAAIQEDISIALAEANAAELPPESDPDTATPATVAELDETAPAAEGVGTVPVIVAEADPLPAFAQTTAPQPETLLAQVAPSPDMPSTPIKIVASDLVMTPQIADATSNAPKNSLRPAMSPVRLAALTQPAEPVAVVVAKAEVPTPAKSLPLPEPRDLAQVVTADTQIASARSTPIVLAAFTPVEASDEPLETVTRVSTSGGREWSINVGTFNNRYNAERMLLQTALIEMNTLDEALRKVVSRKGAFDANFVGMTRETAELACRRLQARQTDCKVVGP